jgi:hypothetical protein
LICQTFVTDTHDVFIATESIDEDAIEEEEKLIFEIYFLNLDED